MKLTFDERDPFAATSRSRPASPSRSSAGWASLWRRQSRSTRPKSGRCRTRTRRSLAGGGLPKRCLSLSSRSLPLFSLSPSLPCSLSLPQPLNRGPQPPNLKSQAPNPDPKPSTSNPHPQKGGTHLIAVIMYGKSSVGQYIWPISTRRCCIMTDMIQACGQFR